MEDYTNLPNPITQVSDMPYALYLSLQGKYFVGYADHMMFEHGKIAWAGLINPDNSGVNLHVYVWTVTDIGDSPLMAQVLLNPSPNGQSIQSEFVTPANTALRPLPQPKVNLLQANNVTLEPQRATPIVERRVLPEFTIASEEEGKFIFPPGGSFVITLSNLDTSSIGEGHVAFGWWEEKLAVSNNGRC